MAKGKRSEYLYSLELDLATNYVAERLREKQSKAADTMDIDSHNPSRETADREDALKLRHDAGVQKPSVKKKSLRRNQRIRMEKGVERAAATIDQLEKKVGESKHKGKVIKGRRVSFRSFLPSLFAADNTKHDWEDINEALKAQKAEQKRKLKTRPPTVASNGQTQSSNPADGPEQESENNVM